MWCFTMYWRLYLRFSPILYSSKPFWCSDLISTQNVSTFISYFNTTTSIFLNRDLLSFKSASTGSVGWPELPGVSSPLINFNGTVKVGCWVTRGLSWRAWSPVYIINLPKSNISWSVSVIVQSISISSTFMADNTFAASLVPTVLSAPGSNILHVLGSSTETSRTLSRWAIASTAVSKCNG